MGPVVLRIKLRYESIDVMVQRFAANVGKSGLFLPTKSVQPVGAEIKFELRLATDQVVLVGVGRVKATKEPDPQDPKATFGMAVELMRVTRESRDLILKMLERRRLVGLGEVSIPMPADIEAARRADLVDTSVRDIASGPIVAAPQDAPASEASLLTSPRRQTGPIAVAKVLAAPALAPESPRKKRPALGELIERASAPGGLAMPGLDEEGGPEIDVAAVMARARTLAGGKDLDAELDALREAVSAPIAEITIEAASAELARQLGGAAVRRGWAPPPAVIESKPIVVETVVEAPEPVAEPAAEPVLEAAPEPSVAEPAPVAEAAPEPLVEAVPVVEAPPVEPPADDDVAELHAPVPLDTQVGNDPVVPVPHDTQVGEDAPIRPYRTIVRVDSEVDRAVEEAVAGFEALEAPGEQEVEPEQIHDEIHQLQESDFEEVEHTAIGEMDANAFQDHAQPTLPADVEYALAERLDAQLAQAEAEAEHDDLGIGEASARYQLEQQQQYGQFGDGYNEPSAGYGASGYETPMPDDGAPQELPEEEIEEIDDFEILAEADAEDADLLAASGEADAPPNPQYPPDRPSVSDFAMRLDLGEDTPHPGNAPQHVDEQLARSAGHALAAFDDDNASYTGVPQPTPGYDSFDEPHAAFQPIHKFDQSDVIDISATLAPPRDSSPAVPVEPDLESALEALDVDLDDLSVPHSRPEPRRETHRTGGTPRAQRLDESHQPTPPPSRLDRRSAGGPDPLAPHSRRAHTDDGIQIDLDDDDDD